MLLRKLFSTHIVFAIILYYFTLPYFVWNIPYKPALDIILSVIAVMICVNNRKNITNRDVILIVLFIITWLFFMIKLFTGGRNIFGIIQHLPIGLYFFIPLLKDEFGKKTVDSYISIYSALIFLSILVWFSRMVINVPSLGIVNHYAELRSYDTFPFLVVERLSLESFRFYGLFDEPGVVGTIGMLLLSILKFNFKDKRTWVIFLSGILSMSFFFYASICIYSLLYLCFVKKAIPQTMLMAAAFVIFFLLTKDNVIFDKVIWSRFAWDSTDGQFAGDNRISDAADSYFASIRGTSEYYLGVINLDHYWKLAEGSSSYKNIIAMYGMIFFSSYCLYFILLAYMYKTNVIAFILFCLLFLLNMYQRPSIYSILLFFLFTAMCRDFSVLHHNYRNSSSI